MSKLVSSDKNSDKNSDNGNDLQSQVSIPQLSNLLRDFNKARDWDQYHNPRNLSMALSVEAGELLELYLWSADDGPQPPVESRLRLVPDEAADVFICLLNFCHHAGVDLAQATIDKIAKNERKYPVANSKGRLEKSDEL